MKFFSEIVNGFKWLGKELSIAPKWIQKVVTITSDVEEDAATLCPQLITLIADVDSVAVAVVKDGGAAFISVEALSVAILAAVSSKGLNISQDAAVVAAFQTFITEVTASGTWTDVLTSTKKLIADYDTFGATAKAALQKLEDDAR